MPNTAPDKRVHVAVGVISDGADKILVAHRAEHLHQGGLWEFPGGKVELNESVHDALLRELSEELAIQVTSCEPLLAITHDYKDKAVLLDVWWISAFQGEPVGREGQPLRWVDAADLNSLAFPAANLPILTAIEKKLSSVNTAI
ncbi:MAG: 7,8-dihydro-8-oxoguanine-triphosphatase [Verrucomicrobiaceae bacterium]|nr:7,8-dihydro-8-oxoguanine-triphosphatase [Verrucomicrobiaceae bacterium]